MARERPDGGAPGRREFLQAAVLGAAGAAWGSARADDPSRAQGRRKVAAVVTEFTYRSHAHVLLENFLEPYLFNGRRVDPGVEVVSLYVDQFPARDMAREVARDYKIPIYPTIAGALCLGGKTLAADAVLSIGEHGNYPTNAKGQREYPRKRFFDEIVAVFEASGRVVPVFNDKHLSYRWDWAKEMVDTARAVDVPRRPPRHRPARRQVGHPLEFRVPRRGRPRPARHQFLYRALGQPQPVQGPLARDPGPLPRPPRSLPGRANLAHDRSARRRDGFPTRRRQGRRHAATGVRVRARRLPRDA
ncbi:MAG: hypothetical protein LC745_00680 [Planctomycetia bacterium]|nr:hypothetical protein [Planctomycetia bacterium]